ncbi:hypothetical protein Tco_0303851 [Tanacetum coccineum]
MEATSSASSGVTTRATSTKEQEEGFIKVKGRKIKRKKANTNIDGIGFTKPKAKFYCEKTSSLKDKTKVPASGVKSTPISNAFEALNSEEVADCGVSNPTKDEGKTHVDVITQNTKSGTKEAVKEQEQDSLWSKFKAANEASKNNLRSSSDLEEDSDEDKVYFPNAEYTSGMGGGFSMD